MISLRVINTCSKSRQLRSIFALLCVAVWYLSMAILHQRSYWSVVYSNRTKFGKPSDAKNMQQKYNSSICNCEREILMKDSAFVPDNTSDRFNWCSSESSLRGRHQKVISYVLYGKVNERYFSLIKNISSTAEEIYPGWIVRIYHNFVNQSGPEQEARDHLCNVYCQFNNIDLCSLPNLIERVRITNNTTTPATMDPGLLQGSQPKMWRFLVALDPNVDLFVSRDLDSMLLQREVDAVAEWLRSNYNFHSMRDHPNHGVGFLGGMWGAKLYQRRDLIEGLIRAILRYGQGHSIESPADQTVLNNIVWPTAQYDMMVHDSYLCQKMDLQAKTWPQKVFPFPTKREDAGYFIGGVGQEKVPGKCPGACRPQDHKDWEYC